MKLVPLIALSTVLAASLATAGAVNSPYAGQHTRQVKALSSTDIESLLAGKGMGFAKPAELNAYPGPLHVLELAAPLQLSPAQRARTEALVAPMQMQAKRVGALYVQQEAELEQLFASGRITPETLKAQLQEIGVLHAELRRIHLETHIAQKAILSPEQIARYNRLRGYDAPAPDADRAHGHRH